MPPQSVKVALSVLAFLLPIGCAQPGRRIQAIYFDELPAPHEKAAFRRSTHGPAALPTVDPAEVCAARMQVIKVTRADEKACMEDERAARREISVAWPLFTAKNRETCIELIKGPSPSYLETLTCLEMSQKVLLRKLALQRH